MIRRLELAQALVSAPRLLILDEPTIGLDPIARSTVWERIAAVRAETGMTVLLTTHYMEEAEQSCDRVALMHKGRLSGLGTPRELIESLNQPDATLDDVFRAITAPSASPAAPLDDVFRAYAGDVLVDTTKGIRDVRATRRTAGRLG